LDIQAVPKRYFFELLTYFTTSELESEKLKEFSSAEGQQDLYTYCNRPKRNVLEVLQDFPHATENIPEDYLFDLIGPIKPRAFSIASSMKGMGDVVQVLVALVHYQTKLKKPRLGLCSNWLARLKPGDSVPVWTEKGSFHFPAAEQVVS
jgi:equilibrative nucleoside transporter 1/2/3